MFKLCTSLGSIYSIRGLPVTCISRKTFACVRSLYVQSACSSASVWLILLKCVAAVQTLWNLHCAGNLCHLDVSPENIMLRSNKSNPWDSLRLIDFGFASRFNPGKQHASLTCMLAAIACLDCTLPPVLKGHTNLCKHLLH